MTPDDFAPKPRLRPVPVERQEAPEQRQPQQKVADLVQLALWLDAIGFLDLLGLAKSITDSDPDPNMPADVKLAKALATWARATIKATA